MTRAEYERAVGAFERLPRISGPRRTCDSTPVCNVRACEQLGRCAAYVCEDIQSGPIYCEDSAVIEADVADEPGVVVRYCRHHQRRMDRHPKAEASPASSE